MHRITTDEWFMADLGAAGVTVGRLRSGGLSTARSSSEGLIYRAYLRQRSLPGTRTPPGTRKTALIVISDDSVTWLEYTSVESNQLEWSGPSDNARQFCQWRRLCFSYCGVCSVLCPPPAQRVTVVMASASTERANTAMNEENKNCQ